MVKAQRDKPEAPYRERQAIVSKFASKNGDIPYAALLNGRRLEDLRMYPEVFPGKGSVFTARVGKLQNGLVSAFVQLTDREHGRVEAYMPLEKGVHPFFLNKNNGDTESVLCGNIAKSHGEIRLLEGDEILVIIRREAQKTKDAVCSPDIRPEDLGVEAGEFPAFIERCIHRELFSEVYKAPVSLTGALKDRFRMDFQEIVTDVREYYDILVGEFAASDMNVPVRLYNDSMINLDKLLGMGTQIEELLQKKVFLKSGGSLIIEATEAMNIIDVNSSGHSQKNLNNDDYVLQVNKEAGMEALRQMRLRNLSGMILIDFINMRPDTEKAFFKWMGKQCAGEWVQTVAVDITKLGIMELTRRKDSRALGEFL